MECGGRGERPGANEVGEVEGAGGGVAKRPERELVRGSREV